MMAAFKFPKAIVSFFLTIMLSVLMVLQSGVIGASGAALSVPLDGHWTGATNVGQPVTLDVTTGGTVLSLFTITYHANGQYCGFTITDRVYTTPPISINNGQFTVTGAGITLSGQFTSPTTANGSYTVLNAYDSQCGYYSVSLTWSATLPAVPGPFGKISPQNDLTNQPTNLTLSWENSGGAASYQYCVDTTNNNSCDNGWLSAGTGTSVQPGGLNPGTLYYWQVQASNSYGSTLANSDTWWHFSTSPCYNLGFGPDPVDGGSISANPPPNCPNGLYTAGTNVSLTANPANGYRFSSWSGDASGSQNPLTVLMNGNKNITAQFYQAAGQPSISGFSPASGLVGTTVVITGANFNGATDVRFNGISALFAIYSDTYITATVPNGATTGPISITTPSGTATSSSNFTVTVHVGSILYAKPAATGTGSCASWANACTLQAALTAAYNGDEIWVMQGTHKPSTTGNREAYFKLKDGVGVYGGFAGTETTRAQRNFTANVTILSGDLLENDNNNVIYSEPTRSDNAYHVVIGSGTTSTAILDGVTVSGANGNGGTSCPGPSCGGGMENAAGSPTVTNVIFKNNSVNIQGGGMSNTGNSQPTLTNVTFEGNSAGTGDGGGLCNSYSSPSLSNVSFINNTAGNGGGIFNIGSNPTLRDIAFLNNTATNVGGGLMNKQSNPKLTNVTFRGNGAANKGGGMYSHLVSTAALVNVTFVENTAASGGGIYHDKDNIATNSLSVQNAIFWGNTPDNIVKGTTSIYLSDSVIPEGCPVGTNSTCLNLITSDPLVGALGSYGGGTQTIPLLPGSPAINAGNATVCPTLDQRGLARVGACDIGAFESQGFTLAAAGGSGQTALPNAAFTAPLKVSVTSSGGEPVNGGSVTFTAPSSGASITTATQQVTIANNAATVSVTANAILGAYQVNADTAGASSPVTFNLANVSGSRRLYAKPAATGSGDCLTWASACTLQKALTASFQGDEIWVMQGAHKPSATGDRAATFQLKSGVEVYGGFAGSETQRGQRDYTQRITILSGDLAGNDNNNIKSDEPTRAENSYHVVTGSGVDNTALLDGFTITGGNAETNNGCPGTGCGGGMENAAGSPTLTHLIFTANAVYINGGAMSNTGGSAPVLNHVTFDKNTALVSAGGAMFNHTSSPTLTNVTFSNNWAYYLGGALYNHDSSPILTNVTFSNNSSSYLAGAIYNYASSNPTLTNVTLVNNQSTDGAGMYNTDNSKPVIHNSIFWGNTPRNIYNALGAAVTIDNSIVGGGCPNNSTCTYIVDIDPLVGAQGSYGGDMQTVPLLPGSPAIDAGDAGTCPTMDQRGLARVRTCDLGAFESQGFTLAVSGGSGQATSVGSAFAAPLKASITSSAGEPVNGGRVTFDAPLIGASVVTTSQKVTITGGSASANATANGLAGSYKITASASGANSVTFDLTNTGDQASTAVQLTSTPNPSKVGQSVTFEATVTAGQGTPTGTVSFYDGDSLLGSDTLDGSGKAQLSVSSLDAGTHPAITAKYSGDADFLGSTSDPYTQTVEKFSTTTSANASPAPARVHQAVTLTAAVTTAAPGAGIPAGDVKFYDGETLLGSASLNESGTAELAISTLPAGTHAITAEYMGSASFSGSTSAPFVLEITTTHFLPLIRR